MNTTRPFGQSHLRVEDARFITGKGRYTDDMSVAGMCHAAFVRSPHAHAKIAGIDTAAAEKMPGVIAVLTFEDFADRAKPIPIRLAPIPRFDEFLQMPLAHDKVRFVGESVAVVIADSHYLAEDALSHVSVDYEPLLAVVTPEQAAADEVLVRGADYAVVRPRLDLADLIGQDRLPDWLEPPAGKIARGGA